MSILHIFKVTDSRWKKSSWATSSISSCHSISSSAAFSQMMQKLLPQLQHFPSPSSSGPATDQSQPFLSARSLRRCPLKGQNHSEMSPFALAGKPDQHCHPPARPRSAGAGPWPSSALPSQGAAVRALEAMENPPAPHTALAAIGWVVVAARPWCIKAPELSSPSQRGR